MKRLTRNAARTKREIIEKSAPLFNMYGYAGTSMKKIVEETGYQMGGIYRHFEKKDDLAKAVFLYNFMKLKELYYQGITKSQSPKEQLLTLMDNSRKMFFSPFFKGGCPILNTAIEVDDTDEVFRQMAVEGLNELIQNLENILEAGKKTGEFLKTIDSKKEANYIIATVEGAIMMGKLKKSIGVIRVIFDGLSRYIEKQIIATR